MVNTAHNSRRTGQIFTRQLGSNSVVASVSSIAQTS